ncbi:MAG: phage tail tape measure protein [Syntrophothermus sp.]
MADSSPMIGELRLSIQRLQRDINEANLLLSKINNGKKNIDLLVNIDGSKLISDVKKVDIATGQTIRTIKELKNGLMTTSTYIDGNLSKVREEVVNLSRVFKTEFNTIINNYNKLNAAQKKTPAEIDKLISRLQNLKRNYSEDSAEFGRLQKEIMKYQNLKNSALQPGKAGNINQNFEKMMMQYKTQQMSLEQFLKTGSRYATTDNKKMLTDENQLRLLKELRIAQELYNKSQQSVNYSGIQKQLDIYNKLSKEEQKQSSNIKNVVRAYDSLIAQYRREGKEVSTLIAQRKKYANMFDTQRAKELSTSKYAPIQDEINKYRMLTVEQQKQPANIQTIVSAYDKLIAQYQREKRDITGLIAERNRYNKLLQTSIVNTNTSKFNSEFNSIINGYNAMDKVQKKNVGTINNTMAKLTQLRSQYSKDSNEYARITRQLDRLQTAKDKSVSALLSSKMTRADYANQGLQNLLHQLKIQSISLQEFMQKAMVYQQPKVFNMLTNSNQEALIARLTAAEQKNTRMIDENTRAKQKNAAINDYKPIQNAINAYKQLGVEQQKNPTYLQRIVAEYDKLIARYRLEGKEISTLISERNMYNKTLERTMATNKKNLLQTLQQYGVQNAAEKRQQQMAAGSFMGSGDARAGIGAKIQNSLIYSTSAMFYGQALMGVRNLITANKDYEKGLIDLSRTMQNVTEKDLANMGKAALDLSKKYGVAVAETQSAMTELARAGIEDPATLKQMSESVLLGLNTTEIKNAEEMTGYLVSTVKQMGLEFGDSNKIIDEWNFLADKYAVKSNDFAEAIQKSGSAAKNVGINLQELNAMTVVLGEATQKSGNEIGTSFQSLFTKLYRPKTVEGLQALGINMSKDEKTFNSFKNILSQVAEKIEPLEEGSKELNQILDLMGATMRKNDISILAKNWEKVDEVVARQPEALGWSTKEMGKIMDTFAYKIEKVKASFTELSVGIGQAGLLDSLKGLFDGAEKGLSFFNSLDSSFKSFLFNVGKAALALTLLSNIMQKSTGTGMMQWVFRATPALESFILGLGRAKYATEGVSAGMKVLDGYQRQQMVSAQGYAKIQQGLQTGTRATGLSAKDAAIQQRAFGAALNATREASAGARLGLTALGIAGTVLATGAMMALMQIMSAFIAKLNESREATKKSIADYDAAKSKVENLTSTFMDNRMSVQDSDTSKKNYIETEKILAEMLGKSTKSIDLQNKSLSEQIGLLDKATVAADKKFIADNASRIEDAKRRLNKKEDFKAYTNPNLDTESKSIITKQGFDIAESNSAGESKQKITSNNSLRETYEALDKTIEKLSLRYAKLEQKGQTNTKSSKALKQTIDVLTGSYHDLEKNVTTIAGIDIRNKFNFTGDMFGTNIKQDLELLDKWEQSLNNLDKSNTGKEFRKKFSKDIKEIEKTIEGMQGLKPIELKVKYDKLLKMKSVMVNSLKNSKEINKFQDDFDKLFNGIDKGAQNAAQAVGLTSKELTSMTGIQEVLGLQQEELTKTSQGLAAAYKEMKDEGHLNSQTALDLMQKYPQLTKYLQVHDGVIKINIKSLEQFWKTQKQSSIDMINNSIAKKRAIVDEAKTFIQANYAQAASLIKLMNVDAAAARQKAINNRKLLYTPKGKLDVGTMKNIAEGRAAPEGYDVGLGRVSDKVLAATSALGDISSLTKQLNVYSNNYSLGDATGYTAPKGSKEKGKKDKSPSSYSSAGVSQPAESIEKDRYSGLNTALEYTNTLLEKNKTLQDNATTKEKIDLVNKEIALQHKKQTNLSNINKEQRKERSEDEWYLKNKGVKFKGTGDLREMINADKILENMRQKANAHKNDKDKTTYNKLKSDYDTFKKYMERYVEIQTKDIPNISQEWWGVEKSINDAKNAIIGFKVELKFEEIEKANQVFDKMFANLDYEESLAGNNKTQLFDVKARKIKLVTDNIRRNKNELALLNKETNKAVLNDETYKTKKKELEDVLRGNITTLIDLTKVTEEERKANIETVEQKIIDIINKGLEKRKKALDDELDAYKKYVDNVIKEREREYATDDYNKNMSKQLTDRQAIQDKINKLMLDTSIEGYQKRKELEKQLKDADEKIAEDRTNRERDLTKQNLEDNVKQKEDANKKIQDDLDKEFSDENKKIKAHEILMTQSFETIKEKFPELFSELGTQTETFYGTFQSYELKFNTSIGNIATKFKDELLPQIQAAIQALKDFDKTANMPNYTGVKFDSKTDYQSQINKLLKEGVSTDDARIKSLYEKKYAKIYSDNNLLAKYGNTIPTEMRQSDANTAIMQANAEINRTNAKEEKTTAYSRNYYLTVKFDPKKDYNAAIQTLVKQGKTNSDPSLKSLQIQRAAKIYRDPALEKKYASTIPSEFRISGSFSKGINAGLIRKQGAYLLHGSNTNPEWVLTNEQMYNLVKNMANNLSVNLPANNIETQIPTGDIILNINIAGNADKNTTNQIRNEGERILASIKKEVNKRGQFKKL